MNILHITPHLGGGIGTVIMDWTEKASKQPGDHVVLCLDYANEKAKEWSKRTGIPLGWDYNKHFRESTFYPHFDHADIVLIHYWDHPMLAELLSRPLPPCRLAFWCHKHIKYSSPEVHFPDRWLDTSPVQGYGPYIWSTGNMQRFLNLKKVEHEGFNIGYVGTISYKKIHPEWYPMCEKIKEQIPEARFTFVGENLTAIKGNKWMKFTGKVDDIAPYLAEIDVFFYPLRADHYGTCEQVLGEAMAAGVVPVVLDNPAERLIVLDGGTGYVEPTEKDCVDAIRFLYDDLSHRKILSHCTHYRAHDLYNIDTMISKWDEVFNSMMHEPKKERGIL